MSEQVPPYVITERSLIRGIVSRWERQYGHGRSGQDKFEILTKLKALDLESASADEVNRIIGNSSWTTEFCSACNKWTIPVIVVGDVPDYESATAHLCRTCFEKASKCWEEPS